MILNFHKIFKKQIHKLPKRIQEQFVKRMHLFLDNPFEQMLNNHALKGEFEGKRSFNITGDIRVIYEEIDADTVLFLMIGTHSELYER